jgi:hypothetical protein
VSVVEVAKNGLWGRDLHREIMVGSGP